MMKRVRVVAVALGVQLLFGGYIPSSAPVAIAAPKLSDLKGVEELRTLFNNDVGKVRLRLFLSPTLPRLVGGPPWVQNELLAKYPKANVRAYAVWFNMFPGDARSKWPSNLLTDARVIHRWDEPKAVGLWYAPNTASIHGELAPGSRWRDGAIL